MKTRKKKSVLSKFLVFCFVLTAVLSVSLTAFAADGELTSDTKGDFSVSGLEDNVTVSAYQIITVNIDDTSHQPESPMYTWVDGVAEWLRMNENETYKDYIDEDDNSVTDAFESADAGAEKNFLEALTAAIKNNTIGLSPIEHTAQNGTAQFNAMAMGEYLVTAQGNDSVKIYQPTTVTLIPKYDEGTQKWILASAEIGTAGTMKSSGPTIDKKVEDDDKTVAIGDTVNYKLTATVPSYPEGATAVKFEIGDTLSEGLTYNVNSVKVYTVDGGAETEVTAGDDTYSVTTNANGNDGEEKTFIIDFAKPFIKANAGATVVVRYNATVNEHALTEESLKNTAFIGFNNNPYDNSSYQEIIAYENVYTFGIELKKVDKDGKSLAGAEFKLSKEDNTDLAFKGSDGVYTYEPSEENTTLAVNSDGTLKLHGFDAGTYILTETKAPNGYVLPNGTIRIIIKDGDAKDDADGTIDTTQNPENVISTGTAEIYIPAGAENNGITINKNVISFDVKNISSNDASFSLPKTGGMGTLIFTAAGIVIMGCAVVMVAALIKKRKHTN